MSQWSRVAVQIKDLDIFKQACEKHGISFRENVQPFQMHGMEVRGILEDTSSRHSSAYLCAKENAYHLVIDNDPNYSSITERVGPNGGLIMRDYAEMALRKAIRLRGGVVKSVTEQKDKSLLMRVFV